MSPKRGTSKFTIGSRYKTLKEDYGNVYYDDHKPLRNDYPLSKSKRATNESPLIFRSYSSATMSSYASSAFMPPPLDGDPTISSSYEEELPTKEEMQHQTLLANDFMREREQMKAENERLAARLREMEATIHKLHSGRQLSSPGLMQASFDDSTISTSSYARYGINRTGTYDSADLSSIPKFAIHRSGTYDSVDVSEVPSRPRYVHPATSFDVVQEEKMEHKKKSKLLLLFSCVKKESSAKKADETSGIVAKPSYSFDDDTTKGGF